MKRKTAECPARMLNTPLTSYYAAEDARQGEEMPSRRIMQILEKKKFSVLQAEEDATLGDFSLLPILALDDHFKVRRDFPVQFHRHFEFARFLDRLFEDHPFTINLVALFRQRLGDIHRGYRTVENAVFTGLADEFKRHFIEHLGLPGSCFALGRFALEQSPAL